MIQATEAAQQGISGDITIILRRRGQRRQSLRPSRKTGQEANDRWPTCSNGTQGNVCGLQDAIDRKYSLCECLITYISLASRLWSTGRLPRVFQIKVHESNFSEDAGINSARLRLQSGAEVSFHPVEMYYPDPNRHGVVTGGDGTRQNALERYPSIRRCYWDLYLFSTTYVSLAMISWRLCLCCHTRFRSSRPQQMQVQSEATCTQVHLVTKTIREAQLFVPSSSTELQSKLLSRRRASLEAPRKSPEWEERKGASPDWLPPRFSF